MHLVFDIFQGIGVAAALGIRPFLPVLAVGGLAAASIQIHFDHTDLSFLQSGGFLLGAALAAVILIAAERRLGFQRLERGPGLAALMLAAAALGALEFAGSLCRGGYAVWPGVLAGVICAAIGAAASRPLFTRVRARLDESAASALALYAEGAALLVAVLSVLAPPVGPIALLLLLWLLWSGRGRGESRYAGLRILR